MTQLAWFPFDYAAWKQRVGRVSVEEHGALLLVCGEAWNDPVPCTIEATDAALDSILGARWRKLADVVRRHFTPCEEHPGRLRCTWLHDDYRAQLARYESAKVRGQKGGTAPGKKRGPKPRKKPNESPRESPADSPADTSANSRAIADKRRGFTPGPDGPGGETPRGDASAAPAAADGRAAPAPPDGDESSNAGILAPAPAVSAALAWLATQPDAAEREAAIMACVEGRVAADASTWFRQVAYEVRLVEVHLAAVAADVPSEGAPRRRATGRSAAEWEELRAEAKRKAEQIPEPAHA